MALNQIGNAADEAAAETARRGDTVVPQHSAPQTDSPDHLLDAIRRSLQPVDPIRHLLAAWPR
jgi:hypothetical protein